MYNKSFHRILLYRPNMYIIISTYKFSFLRSAISLRVLHLLSSTQQMRIRNIHADARARARQSRSGFPAWDFSGPLKHALARLIATCWPDWNEIPEMTRKGETEKRAKAHKPPEPLCSDVQHARWLRVGKCAHAFKHPQVKWHFSLFLQTGRTGSKSAFRGCIGGGHGAVNRAR